MASSTLARASVGSLARGDLATPSRTQSGALPSTFLPKQRVLRLSQSRGAVQSWRRSRASVQVVAETQYVMKPEEGKELVTKEGYIVLDVRDPTQWERSRIKGSVHVPFFVVNEDPGIETAIKRQAHMNFSGMLYGLAFTKLNPTFVADVGKKFPKDAKLLLVCQEGLRANSAADELEDQGYTNLAVLERGLNKVQPGLFEKEGERELKDASKGGFVAIQTQFSVVLACILISALLFLQFFPDAALQVLGE